VIVSILKDVIGALAYFHDKGCFHRDIKAENILIDKNGKAYLSGFGVCNNLAR
jgi:serine/threonine protein kinase